MPIFEKPPLETLTPAKDRWTPIYLEHGRLEVDDSSIKWIGADRLVYRLPVATLSAVLLGPGTTVTHAAMKACADSNTPVCWIGEECMRFYAFGITPNHDNTKPRHHAALWADKKKRAEIARRMFALRFTGVDVQAHSVTELRGMEGLRVRAKYAELGQQYGVTWKGRDYDKSNWNLADGINRALSAANASLYAVCAAVCCSLGYLPSLGFIHDGGTLPFIYDVADLYKEITSMPAAFQAIRQEPDDKGELTRQLLKERIEAEKLLQRMPKDLEGTHPMIVIVANDTPDAIRGMLKRWFIEPRPNVFVGTLNRRTHEKTLEYIKRNAREIGLLIVSSYPNCQGYKVETTGSTDRKGVDVAGLWMIAEEWEEVNATATTEESDFSPESPS